MKGKSFRNNRTDEVIKVIDTFEDIAVLENKQKVSVKSLMDPAQFTEELDPANFFNTQAAYNALAEKIRSIKTDDMIDESVVQSFGGTVQPISNESAIIQTSEEEERAELARKYSIQNATPHDAALKQKQAFSKYLDPEEAESINREVESRQITVQNNPQINPQINQVQQQPRDINPEIYQQPSQVHRVEDPVISIFKNVKRTVEFKISLDIDDKIPRLDFIEMMEDSYDISIIDYLASEFTNKIMEDPRLLQKKFRSKIEELVYGKSIKVEEKSKERKLSVSERIERILAQDSQSEIEKLLKGEKSKKVREEATARIEQLKSNQ